MRYIYLNDFGMGDCVKIFFSWEKREYIYIKKKKIGEIIIMI